MTTNQKSESGYHLHCKVRSIWFGAKYATAFWRVSQSRGGPGTADSAACGRCGHGIGRTVLPRPEGRSTLGSFADSRSPDRGGVVHAPGSRVGGAGFSVHFVGLPRTWGKRPDDRYTGGDRSLRGGCL